jgi:hypothetical protein
VGLCVGLTIYALKTGSIGGRNSTTTYATNPEGFNWEIGALMAITGFFIVVWYIQLLRFLRDRRDKAAESEKPN